MYNYYFFNFFFSPFVHQIQSEVRETLSDSGSDVIIHNFAAIYFINLTCYPRRKRKVTSSFSRSKLDGAFVILNTDVTVWRERETVSNVSELRIDDTAISELLYNTNIYSAINSSLYYQFVKLLHSLLIESFFFRSFRIMRIMHKVIDNDDYYNIKKLY